MYPELNAAAFQSELTVFRKKWSVNNLQECIRALRETPEEVRALYRPPDQIPVEPLGNFVGTENCLFGKAVRSGPDFNLSDSGIVRFMSRPPQVAQHSC